MGLKSAGDCLIGILCEFGVYSLLGTWYGVFGYFLSLCKMVVV